jgi:hypothetical protein
VIAALVLPLAFAKILLVPLGIFAFLLVLLLMGAFGLAVAMGVISLLSRLWRLLSGGRKGRLRLTLPGLSRRGWRRRS